MHLILSAFLTAFVIGIMATMTYWSLDNELPAVTVSVSADPPKVKRGGNYQIVVVADRRRECRFDSESVLWDSSGTRVSRIQGSSSSNENRPLAVQYPYSVPENTSLGIATHVYTALYVCNPMQVIWPLVRRHSAVIEIIE